MAISDNQRDDNADTRQKNQPDSVISNGVWYQWACCTSSPHTTIKAKKTSPS